MKSPIVRSNSISKMLALFPKEYESFEGTPEVDNMFPRKHVLMASATDNSIATVVCLETNNNWKPMPFDQQTVLEMLRPQLSDNEGVIEVETGTMRNGGSYVYNIIKSRKMDGDEPGFGVDYTVNFNFEIGKKIYYINASFEEVGTTGIRDNAGIFIIQKMTGINYFGSPDWFEDPYDSSIKEGFLMNKSEQRELDSVFENHPLSQARKLIQFIVENN